jgi:hypothetical protein
MVRYKMGKGARNRSQRIVLRSTGITIQVKDKYHNEMPDPGEGQHLWTVIGCWRVTPNDDGYNLDSENLLTIEGPGCYKCEQTYTKELAAKPCEGTMDLMDLDDSPIPEPGGPFGDGMK